MRIKVVCFTCQGSVRLDQLSSYTQRRARNVGDGDLWEGLKLLPDADIECEVCAAAVAVQIPLDEYWDLLEDIGCEAEFRVPDFYQREFPDKCRRRADLDALRLNY